MWLKCHWGLAGLVIAFSYICHINVVKRGAVQNFCNPIIDTFQYIWNWKIGFTPTRKGTKVLTKFNWLFVRRFCHILIFSDACTHLCAPFLFFNLVDKLRVVGSSEITSNQEPRLQSTLTTRPVPHYPKLISPFLNCSTLNSPSPHFHFPLQHSR